MAPDRHTNRHSQSLWTFERTRSNIGHLGLTTFTLWEWSGFPRLLRSRKPKKDPGPRPYVDFPRNPPLSLIERLRRLLLVRRRRRNDRSSSQIRWVGGTHTCTYMHALAWVSIRRVGRTRPPARNLHSPLHMSPLGVTPNYTVNGSPETSTLQGKCTGADTSDQVRGLRGVL